VATAALAAAVLAGLGIGFAFLPRETAARAAVLKLRQNDLLSRREDLVARLSNPGLEPADRQRLQLSTARVLRDLDEVEEALEGIETESGGQSSARPAAGRAFVQAHPLLAGVLLGGGVVGLVGALVVWAQADAQPDPEAEQQIAQGGGETDFRGQVPLGPEAASRAEELQRQIEADPADLDPMRSLMQLLLVNERPFDAFQLAQRMLQIDDGDPDARYVSGVVRYMMGQPDLALTELGRSLETEPGHEQAAMMRGLILLQLGDRETAVATWQAANEARESPRLQQVLAMAQEGRSIQEILDNPFGAALARYFRPSRVAIRAATSSARSAPLVRTRMSAWR